MEETCPIGECVGLRRFLRGVSEGGRGVIEGGVIRFGYYNIKNGHNGGLDYAFREMEEANIDLGVM